MRSRSINLSLALLLSLSLAGCGSSKLDRAINAFDAASALPAALGLPADQRICAAEGFRGIATALRAFKADPTGGKWGAVTQAVSAFDSSQCLKDARLVAVLTVAQRIVASIQPGGGQSARAAAPDFGRVRDADIRELERLTRGK